MEQTPARTRRSFTNEFRRDAVAMVLDDENKIVDVARRPAHYSARRRQKRSRAPAAIVSVSGNARP